MCCWWEVWATGLGVCLQDTQLLVLSRSSCCVSVLLRGHVNQGVAVCVCVHQNTIMFVLRVGGLVWALIKHGLDSLQGHLHTTASRVHTLLGCSAGARVSGVCGCVSGACVLACMHFGCVVLCEQCNGVTVGGWWRLCLLYTCVVAVCVSAYHAGCSIVLQSTMYTASTACSEWFVFWFLIGVLVAGGGCLCVCLQQ